jgi:hypothetical protein
VFHSLWVGKASGELFNENVGQSSTLSNFDINLMGVIGYKLTSGAVDTPPVVTVQNLTAARARCLRPGHLPR